MAVYREVCDNYYRDLSGDLYGRVEWIGVNGVEHLCQYSGSENKLKM